MKLKCMTGSLRHRHRQTQTQTQAQTQTLTPTPTLTHTLGYCRMLRSLGILGSSVMALVNG